jgi:tryptophan synthase alpha chain
MTRINAAFRRVSEKNESALVGFVTAGDPDMDTSREIIAAMCENGVDILELGVPFSDPTADGPVIQRASTRALQQGIRLDRILSLTAQIRRTSPVPIILFSYYNPIMAYGPDAFYRDAVDSGADGLLVVDLPPEEAGELISRWSPAEFSFIRLIAPTTPRERMEKISRDASGFLYLVSTTGVTGSGGVDTSEIQARAELLRSLTGLPICVGFGISTPEQVSAISAFAEGVVIGSAFERTIEENLEAPDLPQLIGAQTAAYKAATRRQRTG